MDVEAAPSVLRCELCSKPFNNESTLKRHGYYCRSRKNGNAPRVRSCNACVKAKTRCDKRRPECSRCRHKAWNCQYPSTVLRPAVSSDQTQATSSSFQSRQQDNHESDSSCSSSILTGFEPDWLDSGDGVHVWNDLDLEFLDDQAWQGFPCSTPTDWLSEDSKVLDLVQQAYPIQDVTIPRSPSYSSVRSLVERPKPKASTQGITTLMLSILKTYPRMMLHHGTHPPFIHPGLMSLQNEIDSLESLNNCISLMHMISSGVRGSRKLFWRNVRTECERCLTQYTTLDRWELLGVMQALLIYILLRVDEGETKDNNLDFLLLAVVAAVSKQLAQTEQTNHMLWLQGRREQDTRWIEWVLEETSRRICTIYQVVNMLVYFEPAAICNLQSDLVLAPLPSKKALWEATDSVSWRIENERIPGSDSSFGLAANGELVKLYSDQVHCHDSGMGNTQSVMGSYLYQSVDWEDWCSGMDGFGGLIMLAASLRV